MGKQNAAQPMPVIFRLDIKRFRGLSSFTWWPAKGVNVILGGGPILRRDQPSQTPTATGHPPQ
jgi:hypothetical protein